MKPSRISDQQSIPQSGNYGRVKVYLAMFLVFAVLSASLFFVLTMKKNNSQQRHLDLTAERYDLVFSTIYNQYRQLAINLQAGLMTQCNIQDLYQKLQTADKEQKTILRQELLQSTQARFAEMHEQGGLQSLHFHLKNNESFFRAHWPEQYGDDLTDIRPLVSFVNAEQIAADGFESGRLSGGFRFVFPISGENKKHLGSMEFSFGPEAITTQLMKQYTVLSNFYINKSFALRSTSSPRQPLNYTSSHHDGYFYNENVLAALKEVSKLEMNNLKPSKKITAEILKHSHGGKAKSVYDPEIDAVFTIIPVFNPITHEQVAFCSVRSQSEFFKTEAGHFGLAILISQSLLVMIFLAGFLQYRQRKIVEAHSADLQDQTEQLLRTQKILQRERDMFMQGPVMTFTWDNKDGWPVTHVSPNVLDILGYAPEEFLNGSLEYLSIVHADDQQRITNDVVQNSVDGTISYIHDPYRLVTQCGKIIWVHDSTIIVRNAQGDVVTYQGYLVDITKMVLMEKEVVESRDQLKTTRKEEQLKRLESLKTMAGAIAHRFNNAMMAIEGNLELLRCTLPADSNESRMAIEAARAARGASQVGSMMLSYVGQKPLQLQDVSLPDLVGKSIESFKKSAPSIVSINVTLPEEPIFCSVDQLQITEVLESLFTNAKESMGQGPGVVGVSYGTAEFKVDTLPIPFQNENIKDGVFAFCQITDTGHGISPKNLSFIFEPFYTTRFVGRGLGLALTVGIMRTHGGAVVVESIPGKGTTVKVLFPPVSSPEVVQDPDDQFIPTAIVPLSGNLLFVDDESMVLDVGTKMLEMMGFSVQSATNGFDALDLIRSQVGFFKAVVMDISMPEMDGFETLKKIRAMEPDLPVLLCSGYSEDDFTFAKDQSDKPDGFLNKPFLITDMRKSLEGILESDV